MTGPVSNIYKSAIKDRQLNILVYMLDGSFEYYLAQAYPEHHFYCLKQTAKVQYNDKVWSSGGNFHLSVNPPMDVVFDYVLCNDISQHKSAHVFSQLLNVPLIFIEHTTVPLPSDAPIDEDKHYITHKLKEGKYLPYGVIEIEPSVPKDKITVISEFAPRDVIIVQELLEKVKHPISIYGSNIGISNPINSYYDYINILAESQIYLHITSDFVTPINVLHAMSAGCIVIGHDTPLMRTLIPQDCGFVINNMYEIKNLIDKIINNKEEYIQYGLNARRFIKDNFSINNLTTNLQNIFKQNTYL